MAYTLKSRTKKASHIAVDAGPGCGKTSTAMFAINAALNKFKPSGRETDEQLEIIRQVSGEKPSRIGIMAFNRSIAEELKERVPSTVDSRTFHSFGYSILCKNGFKFRASEHNNVIAARDILGFKKNDRVPKEQYTLIQNVDRVVSGLKSALLEPSVETVSAFCEQRTIEVGSAVLRTMVNVVSEVMDVSRNIRKGNFQFISIDDLIWLPVVLNLEIDRFDLLLCDESQDLDPAQQELVMRSGDRLVFIGDYRQAIYGFRGADVNAISNIQNRLKETKRGLSVLPLQISFRLPKSGVENVNDIAPNLRALDSAIEGEISHCQMSEMVEQTTKHKISNGDLVVSRINGNLFKVAYRLLKQKIPVRVQGREFGEQIISIVMDGCQDDSPIEQVVQNLKVYDQRESQRLEAKMFAEKLLDAHNEKMNCLFSLCEGHKTALELVNTIKSLFSSELKRHECVLLSTIHRAKGLEADKVWFLEPNLVPHPMASEKDLPQETNLKFVAETRHKKVLIYVQDDPTGDDDRL